VKIICSQHSNYIPSHASSRRAGPSGAKLPREVPVLYGAGAIAPIPAYSLQVTLEPRVSLEQWEGAASWG
jgi:hypothetical protein